MHLTEYQRFLDHHAWDVVRVRFLLFNSRECGKDFADDIKINHQIIGHQGSALQVQRWTGRVVWT